MITNNEKLALARAVYGEAWLTESTGVVSIVTGAGVQSFEKFDPEHDANQCHQCWDKLVEKADHDGVRCEIEKNVAGQWLALIIMSFKDRERPELVDHDSWFSCGEPTMLSAMTAAMIQLPAVQGLLKEIEG